MNQPDAKPTRIITTLYLVALSAVVVLAVHWANTWFQSYRDEATRNFDATGNLWRWFIGAFLLVVAGSMASLGIRSRPFSMRGFDWRRALAMGAIPLFVAMTMPATIWNWPGPNPHSSSGWLVETFVNNPQPAWLLVGVAIAAGVRETPTECSEDALDAAHIP